jgi:hypothetical protein
MGPKELLVAAMFAAFTLGTTAIVTAPEASPREDQDIQAPRVVEASHPDDIQAP